MLIFKGEIPTLFANNVHCTKFNEEKASSCTSKSTASFFEKMRNETGTEAIPFKCIPHESPDVSLMNYFAFGLLK